jgi:hypothetical protein
MARNPNGKGGGSEKGHGSLYKKEYCEMLITHMSQGYSFTSFGADVGTCGRTLFEWCQKHPEFDNARRAGHEAAKKYLEKIAHAKTRGQDLYNKKGEKIFDAKRADTALIIFFLKTRFRDEYTEKIELDNANSNINVIFKGLKGK